MAQMYFTAPLIKWRAPPTHDKHGRLINDTYFFHVTNSWHSIYKRYTERGYPPGVLELPANARPSRHKLHAKLQRYRKRVNRNIQ